MRQSSLLVLLLLLTQAAAPGAAKESADPVNRIFLVGETSQWIDTGLRVRPEDHLTVRAGSEVCFSAADPQSCVRAVGWPRESYPEEWPASAGECEDPFPEWNHAALVARVGGEIFEVGRSTIVEGREGPLELAINDCSFEGDHRNEGQFSVVVVVENPSAYAARGGLELIEEAIKAMGGKAINDVGSLAVKADCTGPGEDTFTTEILSIRPDRTLFRQSFDGTTVELVAVGDKAWQIDRELGTRKELSKKMRAMIEGHEFQLILFELDERFRNHTVPKVDEAEGGPEPAETADGCILVEMEDLEGLPASVCLDPETKMPVRLSHQPPGGKKEPTIVIELESWLEINGVQYLAGFTLLHGEDRFTYAFEEIRPNSVGRSVFKEVSKSALDDVRKKARASRRGESLAEDAQIEDEGEPPPVS